MGGSKATATGASSTSAKGIIAALNLQPHAEGGWFIETFRDSASFPTPSGPSPTRSHSSCIYYLLARGEQSHWHKVDAVEVWHYYAGAPLRLRLWKESFAEGPAESSVAAVREVVLGGDIIGGEKPQVVVEKGEWQSAVSLGEWTLVGCTVSPGFIYQGFVVAKNGWEPGHN